MELRVYIEGGGDHRGGALATEAREAFSRLFKERGLRPPKIIACGGRSQTFNAWKTACSTHPDARVLLLVDSEKPVADIHKPIEHLRKVEPGWKDWPPDATDADVFLMTQAMEAWLLADPAALAAYFKDKFKASKLPKWPDLEAQAKDKLNSTLKAATSETYDKGANSFKVLREVNPRTLEQRCPSAKRLFESLAA